MKKLNSFLLKSYVGPLVLTFCIGIFVLLMQFLWRYVDDLVGKGLDLWTICKFMFYACWTFVPMALPLAVLLSSLMFFGNMGEHYELVALKAAGIPLRQSMRPLIGVCFGICLLAFFFANYAAPKAYLNYRVLYHEIRSKKPALDIPEGVYYKQIDGYTIRVDKKERDGAHLKGVQIYDHTAHKGNTNVTMAERGYMQTSEDGRYMTLTLYDGHTYG
ncbi:MAG: LptF/LptG family permease, partial [Bacteroidales bacterium]|nr:LptF/LptG family permease [Bacteroidales bacterium]